MEEEKVLSTGVRSKRWRRGTKWKSRRRRR
jgi:hypothetical protein